MNKIRLFLSAMGTLARIFGYCTILSAFLDEKRPRSVGKRVLPVWLYLIAYVIVYLLWPSHDEMMEVMTGALISVGVYLFYKAGLSKALIGTSLAVSMEFLAETILVLAVSVINYFKIPFVNGDLLWMLKGTMGVGVLFWALTRIFSVFFNRTMPRKELAGRFYRLGANVMPIICIVGAVSTVQQVYVLQIDGLNASSLLMAVFTLVELALLSFYLFGELKEGEYLKTEKQRMELQQIGYAHELRVEREAYEKSQRVRHDMKNHIILLGELMKQEDYKGLNEYISRLYTEMATMKFYANSGHKDLDSIINYKLSDAEKMGIEADVSITVPKELGIESFDLNILLGNLLDNALEAVKRCREKEVSVIFQFLQGVLYVTVRNTYDGVVNLDQMGKYRSRKEDADQHGIGLSNVRSVVEKYNGEMQLHSDGEEFSVYIMLYPIV